MTIPEADCGTCFGFQIRSGLPFSYLRGGTGQPLHIIVGSGAGPPDDNEQPVLHWAPPAAPFEARLYADAQTYRLWIARGGWFAVDPHQRVITASPLEDGIRQEERFWGIPSALCFAARGDVPLHAAAVEIGGRAVIVAAPGQFGKTTIAAGFAEAGHRVLSEDLTCVRPCPLPSVIPGPAMLRLRRDVVDQFAMPWGTVVGEHDGRVHVAMKDRGTCEPVPIAALVLLRWTGDRASIEPHAGIDALADLWTLSFHIPNSDGRTRCFQGLSALLDEVPVFNLWRRPTFEGMRTAVDLVTELGLSAASSART